MNSFIPLIIPSIALLPVVLVYLFLSKFIVKGIAADSVKG